MKNNEIIKKIIRLKKEKNAIILAHNYQIDEVQDIADFVGDSLQLAKEAKYVAEDLIIFCGVKFMAESAKILNPKKRVLLPVLDAGCPMADMVDAKNLRKFKEENPEVQIVTYVNSSAEVKAESDICCTSSNAVAVVNSLNVKKILFVPDKNLGAYVEKQLKGIEVVKWNGFCPTHHKVSIEDVNILRKKYPDINILVHPECKPEVINSVDFTGSTSQILQYVKQSKNKKFIIGTEKGIIYTLKKENPGKEFIILSENLLCPNMKKTTLKSILNVLENENNEILVDQIISDKARNSLERMLSL